jgi:hypothetical protein
MGNMETVAMLEMQKKHTNIWLHLILSIIFLPWLCVWAILGLSCSSHNKKVQKQIDMLTASATGQALRDADGK